MRESTLKRFLRLEQFDEHLELHRLDCLASHGRLETYRKVLARLRELPGDQLRPKLLVTGVDLIGAGYQPGPRFAQMLAAVEDAQLEGKVHTPEEALVLLRQRFGEP
jgi:poly(A) polymerase